MKGHNILKNLPPVLMKQLFLPSTLDSGINVAPGITVDPPLKKFHIMILVLFYINLGIAIIFDFFCLQNFSKINKRTPTFIPESTLISLISVEVGINVEGVQKLPNH